MIDRETLVSLLGDFEIHEVIRLLIISKLQVFRYLESS